ncbi:MAG TPA: HlyD family efflux transporter periplasmic adaptor subunit [Candidatus Binatia bacterium]|nr:HlyD family efflux transporter periplasmic adaptor subunit [Candidatus Binatia bacterium]
MKRFIIPFFAVAAATFGVISIVGSHPKREASTPPSPPSVSPYQHTVAAVGLVETSTENIAIGTPLSDVVREVFVSVGQPVRAGEPLFKLDDRHLRAELTMRQADLRVADSQVEVNAAMLDDVTRHLTFAESLKNKNAISAEDLARRQSAVTTAHARLDAAKAQVTAAAAQIRFAETQIERSIIRAPIDGEVLQVKIHPGEFAVAGATATPLILLGRLRPLHIRVDVDEHEAWRVRPEAKATASVRGNPDLKAPLTFVRFEPFVVPKKSLTGDSTERVDTRVLQVIYRLENVSLPLFVGQQMDVFIDAADQKTAFTMK